MPESQQPDMNNEAPDIAELDEISYSAFDGGFREEDNEAFAAFLSEFEGKPELEEAIGSGDIEEQVAKSLGIIASIEAGEAVPDPSEVDLQEHIDALIRIVPEEAFVSPEQPTTPEQAADMMEHRHFAKTAPKAKQQAAESDRTTPFSFFAANKSLGTTEGSSETKIEMTEQEGLEELISFLDNYVVMSAFRETLADPETQFAFSLLENLTFIGDKEYSEACDAIAASWKQQLDANPNSEIAVLTEISNSVNLKMRKSDDYLFEQIMLKMSDEELAQYGPRIVRSVDELTAEPEDAKIILLDDWTISGSQLISAYQHVWLQPSADKYIDSTEIQLIASNRSRVEYGLDGIIVDSDDNPTSFVVPVKSYYLAHDANPYTSMHGAHITGLHSSVDYDFEEAIASGLILDDQAMPPLTNIIRPYRHTNTTIVRDENGAYRKIK